MITQTREKERAKEKQNKSHFHCELPLSEQGKMDLHKLVFLFLRSCAVVLYITLQYFTAESLSGLLLKAVNWKMKNASLTVK